MKTRMTIKQQIIKAVDMSNKKKHTEDCIDANDDTSVFQGECICPKSNPPHTPGPGKYEILTRILLDAHYQPKDAMEIVKAWNAHSDLLEALKDIYETGVIPKGAVDPDFNSWATRLKTLIARAEKGE